MYAYRMLLHAAAADLCVVLLLLLHQQCCGFLLLFVVLCRMVKFWFWFVESIIPVLYFSSFERGLFFMYPLAVLCRIYGLDWPTSSVFTGMRGAKAGVSPPRRDPSCILRSMRTSWASQKADKAS